ncbi:flagellin [Pseudoxanthomonas sp. GM95]|uniref:flagellin N-terminal helical domain-containing protein n=1 Tax=Pseudoxanthomonas sp. GM95 TaxID=1881043 RepID=UPI0008CBA157|nr:flagellin [Pseudoxanthomonas sp. GM95]SEK51183.1 flagellin [Pseudoxanthomonas sp. GM95]
MSSVINTNVMSLNAQRNLTASGNDLATSLQRLSSGLRINSAKDDAAGLAISQRMTTQIKGLDQAARNANDGISLAQTAEGALSTIGDNLQRIRELTVQAANGTNSDDDQAAIQKEITALGSEIGRVLANTQFNGKTLFGTDPNTISIQVGSNATANDQIDIVVPGLDIDTDAFDVTGVTAGTGVADQLTAIDDALTLVSGARADLGAVQNRFTSVVANLSTTSENLSAARSRIQDTDYAKESAALTRNQILQQAGTAMLAQANQSSSGVLKLIS